MKTDTKMQYFHIKPVMQAGKKKYAVIDGNGDKFRLLFSSPEKAEELRTSLETEVTEVTGH